MDIRPIDANTLYDDAIDKLSEGEVLYGFSTSDIDNAPTLSLNTLRDAIYQDAVGHGLWEDEDGIDWYQESHSMIECEVDELYDAIEDRVNCHGDEHFAEELADVIIMSMSVAGKLGIDIDAAIKRKMAINKERPWKHRKELGVHGEIDP